MKFLIITCYALILTYLFTLKERQLHVGIMMQPSNKKDYPSQIYDYIAEPYVLFLESVGIKVIAVPYRVDYKQLKQIFKNLNGLLIPGGSTKIEGPSEYTKKVEYLIRLARNTTSRSGPFPIFAICLGHELVSYLYSNYDENYKVDIWGSKSIYKKTFVLNPKAIPYKYFNQTELKIFSQQNLVFYHHIYAISYDYFMKKSNLSDNFIVTAVGWDEFNQKFVAATQGKHHPIITVQYHPEKPFSILHQNINSDAKQIAKLHALSFYQLVKQNQHIFDMEILDIHNYEVRDSLTYGHIYIFHYSFWKQ
ncbi:hypothetical protein pb186bvf_012821 [Paramecium bursaria]